MDAVSGPQNANGPRELFRILAHCYAIRLPLAPSTFGLHRFQAIVLGEERAAVFLYQGVVGSLIVTKNVPLDVSTHEACGIEPGVAEVVHRRAMLL